MIMLDRLPTIDLDELTAQSALLTRMDRKYLLPLDAVADAVAAIDEGAQVLAIDERRYFQYASVYFDTPQLMSFYGAAYAHKRRVKVRTRHYLDTGTAFLEVKTRGERGVTVKRRMEHPPTAVRALTGSAHAFIRTAFAESHLPGVDPHTLAPTVDTAYRRCTVALPGGAGRVTIDTDLTWMTPDGQALHRADLAIVETKSPSSPSTFDRMLWRRGYRPLAFSKYATGLAALRPHLPRNRWARTLRGFDQPAPVHPTPVRSTLERNLSCPDAA